MVLHLNTANFNVQSLKGAKIFFCFPIFSIFGALASETCIISCYYTPDRRTFFKSLRGAQKSREDERTNAVVNKFVVRLVGKEGCVLEGPASEGGKKRKVGFPAASEALPSPSETLTDPHEALQWRVSTPCIHVTCDFRYVLILSYGKDQQTDRLTDGPTDTP